MGSLWRAFPASIARLATELCRRLGEPHEFAAGQVPIVEHRYVGPAYAVSTEAGEKALRSLAQLEGIVLDPVYTAKAYAGLLDMMEQGALGKAEPVIFCTPGACPLLFAVQQRFRRNLWVKQKGALLAMTYSCRDLRPNYHRRWRA